MNKYLISSLFGGVALFLAASQDASAAGILTLESSGRSIEGVAISKSGVLKGQSGDIPLVTIGAGVRVKKVAILNVKVYVAQLLVGAPAEMDRSDAGAASSILKQKTMALTLDFLRDVDTDKLITAFEDGLRANGINPSQDSETSAFLNAVRKGGNASEGDQFVIAGEKLQGREGSVEILTIEHPKGKPQSISGQSGFLKKIFSIWLGTPSDSKLQDLKQSLLGR